MIFKKTYLGIQFGGVLSTSHVANNFIGTGFKPTTGGGLFDLSAMFSRTEKNIAPNKHCCYLEKERI